MLVHHALPISAEVDWIGAQAAKPAPKRKNGSPERDFQCDQVRWLRDHLPAGSVVFAVKNEHVARSRSPKAIARFYAMREAEGVVSGFPDIGIALAAGRVLWCENKSPRGTLSDAQRDMHAVLRALGHTVFVARTIDQTRAGLIAAGVVLACAANEAAKTNTPRPRTVTARIGGSRFALPVDKVPAFDGGER